jgi:phosphatidylserine/phosphatidylglycerophosphate/cardiolipin synthase-like enzyme
VTHADPRAVAELFNRLRRDGQDTWNPKVDNLPGDPASLTLAFRALSVQAAAHEATETIVVPAVTTPSTSVGVRRIGAVLDELLAGAQREVVVLGYELSDPATLGRLAETASRGVRVELLLDSAQTSLDLIRKSWPRGGGVAHLWQTGVNPRGKAVRLHAKVVIVDGRRALMGSANLTRSGLRSNLEVAVLLNGPVVAGIRAYAGELIDRRLLIDAGEVSGKDLGLVAEEASAY